MNPTLRNIIAVIAGVVIGGTLNGIIIGAYPSLFPYSFTCPPEDFECFKANVHLLEIEHLICVFLAHGLGTLLGAFIAAKIGISNHLRLAMIVGALFFIGGVLINAMLNFTPLSFAIIDILFAYFPMAWIGWKLSGGK